MQYAALALPDDPKLAGNITHFARALRKAGLPIGPGRITDAITAVQAAGFTRREDFFWTLQACFVSKPDERLIFAQIFRLYWRDPQFLEHMMGFLTPMVRGTQDERVAAPAEKRAAQALLDDRLVDQPDTNDEDVEIDIDATQTATAQERLKSLDFEQMSTAEMAEAQRLLAKLTLPVPPILSRRTQAGKGDLPDWPATMRSALRRGGELQKFATKRRRTRFPNLIVLCDISGSMSQYSRAVLHFVHAVANKQGQGWADVHAFTFGTRLTNITRHMKNRDVDAALAAAGAEAQDWEGGTRIADCLDRFNRDWSRRVMGQGAVVLLITDGLDRDNHVALGKVMERLRLTSKQLIWLNPLLRWDGFTPRAAGVTAMLPHVTSFRAAHNIASLAGLADALSRPDDSGDKLRMMRKLEPHKPQDTGRLGWSLDGKLGEQRRTQ